MKKTKESEIGFNAWERINTFTIFCSERWSDGGYKHCEIRLWISSTSEVSFTFQADKDNWNNGSRAWYAGRVKIETPSPEALRTAATIAAKLPDGWGYDPVMVVESLKKQGFVQVYLFEITEINGSRHKVFGTKLHAAELEKQYGVGMALDIPSRHGSCQWDRSYYYVGAKFYAEKTLLKMAGAEITDKAVLEAIQNSSYVLRDLNPSIPETRIEKILSLEEYKHQGSD